jgi:hypothetical protein
MSWKRITLNNYPNRDLTNFPSHEDFGQIFPHLHKSFCPGSHHPLLWTFGDATQIFYEEKGEQGDVENDEIDWQQYDKSHFLNPAIAEKLDRILTLDIAEKLTK